MKVQNLTRRLTALLPALSLLLSLAACGQEEAKATTMHLKRAEGTVAVSDDTGEDVPLLEDLGLYSGYGVDTRSASFAWIDLDSVKLTKMDEDSEIAIRKEDKLLEIEVKSGSLFFNVTEPLAEDETMTIRTSTMMVGIRGTCGWVAQDAAALLEGTVEVTAGEQSVTLSAGERAVLTAEGTLEVTGFTPNDVPAFVVNELAGDDGLAQAVWDSTGLDVPAYAMASYEELLSTMEDVVYSEVIDFEQDGSPELLIICIDAEENSTSIVGNDHFVIYRNGPDGPEYLYGTGGNRDSDTVVYSLVESNGRLYLCRDRLRKEDGQSHFCWYYGSVAQRDGSREDWGTADCINQGRVNVRDERGLVPWDAMEEYYDYSSEFADTGAVRGKYSHVRDLLIYNQENITVVEP